MAGALQRQHAEQHRQREAARARTAGAPRASIASTWARSYSGWVMIRCAPAAILRSRRSHSVAASAAVGSSAQAIVKPGRGADRAAGGVLAAVEPGEDLDEPDRVDVPDARSRSGSRRSAADRRSGPGCCGRPSACAPSSSDSRAIRFRSRVVMWTRHSRSRSCWMPNATASAPIRTRAIAESLTLTASTPAAWSSRAASIVRSMRTERGGSISTEMTNRRVPQRPEQPGRGQRGSRSSSGADVTVSVLGPAGRDGRLRRAASRRERVERRPHRRDVLGRGPAAAADDRCPGVDEARRPCRPR